MFPQDSPAMTQVRPPGRVLTPGSHCSQARLGASAGASGGQVRGDVGRLGASGPGGQEAGVVGGREAGGVGVRRFRRLGRGWLGDRGVGKVGRQGSRARGSGSRGWGLGAGWPGAEGSGGRRGSASADAGEVRRTEPQTGSPGSGTRRLARGSGICERSGRHLPVSIATAAAIGS